MGDVLVALALGHLPLHRVDELAVAVNLGFFLRKNLHVFSPFHGFLNWSVVTSGAKAASRVYIVIMTYGFLVFVDIGILLWFIFL